MSINGVIFDLDGVIVTTDDYHTLAWKRIAKEEGINFEEWHKFRGVSRMECVEILTKKTDKVYSDEEKMEIATKKNNYYLELLKELSHEDILPGVMLLLEELKKNNIKIAIGSSSKNTPFILDKIGLGNFFDTVVDGNDIKRSKPDPEVFVLAAEKLGLLPKECLVIEDADAGVEAAIRGNMKVLGVAHASKNIDAHYKAEDLKQITFNDIYKM